MPSWSDHTSAEDVLVQFLVDHNGRADSLQLHAIYVAHPWLKDTIGPLPTFCAESDSIVFIARSGKRRAQLHLRSRMPNAEFTETPHEFWTPPLWGRPYARSQQQMRIRRRHRTRGSSLSPPIEPRE